MKAFLNLFILLFITNVSAQYAIVNDPDGYTYMRSAPQKDSKKILTLKNGVIVYGAFEEENGWRPVDYWEDGELISGYIYNERLKYLERFGEIPRKKLEDNSVVFNNPTITVELNQKPFDPKGRNYTYSVVNVSSIDLIDGKETWGTDGSIPTREYASIDIIIDNKKFSLPDEALKGLYQPNLNHTQVYYDKQSDRLYIEAWNSDAAGSYVVLWVIEKDNYKERHLTIPF